MKKYLFLLLFVNSVNLFSQQLHHQMISAQGTSVELANGIIVSQTIGQQSLIGTYHKKDILVSQGFQQVFWNNLIIIQMEK